MSEVDDDLAEEGEDKPLTLQQRLRTIRYLEDGRLSNQRGELMLLYIVDDLSPWKAWQLLGGKDHGGSGDAARRVKRHPLFVERLANLMAEKDEMMKDPQWGAARHAATQMWRIARAKGDDAMAMEAMKSLARIAEKSGSTGPSTPEPDAARTPGKPSVEVPKAPGHGGEITRIRSELLRLGGVNAP